MTILNESGTPDVVSPLRGLYSLAQRLPDTLFVVAGTRADAYMIRALSGLLPGSRTSQTAGGSEARRRVVFVVLEPDEKPRGGALASRVVEAAAGFRRVGSVMVVACRSASLLGLDAGFEAELAGRRLSLPVRAVPTDVIGPGALSTDLEDGVIRSLVELCPRGTPVFAKERSRQKGGLLGRLRSRPGRQASSDEPLRRPVVLLGALPGPQEELAAELSRAGVEVAGVVPGAEASLEANRLPEVAEGTVVAATDPYLSGACWAARERGATMVETSPPIGVDGTARFIQDVAAAAGHRTSETRRARRVWESLEHLRSRIRGRRVFFTGDTGLEVPVARFLA
ncbi:MAG TPA: nitrogenase component 1, partial [Rubrobacteraceae bacterium]|nr:nitrogenase component 1 [Rubrobacteraceae bacterium]